ncbi:MAG TPA: hypothetical protein VD765_04625 [Solirubrobacterales bacterium]|nr:hypothetical protein [Solirubrobacterales bacterium]
MRDLVVREALEAMAFDAADRLRELIAAGEEIPYEVREPGDGSPLCRYEPRTEVFVHDHAGELRELDSFGTACAAVEIGGLATAYLERMGIGVPEDARKRAEIACIAFLCRLWMASSDFSLEAARLDAAIDEVDAGSELNDGGIEVIVPLRGLQMPVARLDLEPASIVRADTVEVPPEARSADGLGVSPWEPTFIAVVRVDETEVADGDAGLAAVESFRRLTTTLRLFKAGGVGLGPHAWTRIAGDRWRRIATGSGRQRPGGYRLTDPELGELLAFSRSLAIAGTPFERLAHGRPGVPTVLGRALARFEAGLERNVVVEALNDHLLSLRFLLEGGGPADLGLSMRVAALCAEPDGRDEVKAVVDRAQGLERELWSGEPSIGSGSATPAETGASLEDLARAILKDAAAGHLGSDLRVTADEILLADGLAAGEGAATQRGGTTEWDLTPVEPEEIELSEELEGLISGPTGDPEEAGDEQVSELDARITPEPSPEPQEAPVSERAREIFGDAVPEPERGFEAETGFERERRFEADEPTTSLELVPAPAEVEAESGTEMFDYEADQRRLVDDDGRPRPASPVLRLIEQTRAEREARTERVAGLFPAPETTEWNVRDITYDRNRRAGVSPQ